MYYPFRVCRKFNPLHVWFISCRCLCKIHGPFLLLYYFQGPLQAVLQALNLAGAAMTNSLIGAVVKTGMIFVLASQPSFGIMGAALAILIGIVLVTLLHAATVGKVLPIHLPLKEYGLCVLVIMGTGAVSLWMKHQASGLFSAPLELVMMIF